MTRLAFLLAGAWDFLFSFGTAAYDKPEAKEKEGAALVAERFWWGTEFEVTL